MILRINGFNLQLCRICGAPYLHHCPSWLFWLSELRWWLVNQMLLYGWPCSVHVEWLVMWRWENIVLNECCRLCATIKYLFGCWQVGSHWYRCSITGVGKRFEKTARVQLDWDKWEGAYIYCRWLSTSSNCWNLCRAGEIFCVDEWTWVCTRDQICSAWCWGRRKGVSSVSTQCKAGHCIGLIKTPPGTPLQIYRNFWLPYCHQVHCKAVCKSIHVKGCEVVSSLPWWSLFLQWLLVIPAFFFEWLWHLYSVFLVICMKWSEGHVVVFKLSCYQYRLPLKLHNKPWQLLYWYAYKL